MRTLIMSGLLCWQIATGLLFSQAGYSSASVSRTRSHGLMEPQQVIVEEFMNYHTHDIALPGRGEMLGLELKADRLGRTGHEGQDEEWVFQVGLTTQPVEKAYQRPPINLSLVVDGSGSMGGDQKMEKVKRALVAFLGQLRPDDHVSLIRFSADASLEYHGYAGEPELQSSLLQIYPGGGTNLHAGLMLGLSQLGQAKFSRERAGRVILLTDGLANEGIVDFRSIMAQAERYLEEGIHISTIGVGADVNFDLLAELARQSGGQHHFIGSSEADIVKVFEEEAESLLGPLLEEVSMTIELPEELQLLQFFGYQPQINGNEIVLDLPPLNRGLTQVMVFHCVLRSGVDFSPVVVHLDGSRLDNGVRQNWRTRLYTPGRRDDPSGWSDLDIQKNYSISYMAHTLKEMVMICQSGNCRQAKVMANECIAYVKDTYPDLGDPDILRVLNMLQQQRGYISMME